MVTGLTKSAFLDYVACPQSFWLARHEPHRLAARTVSAFDRMLAADGYAVERQARLLVEGLSDPDAYAFQVGFDADDCSARADIVRTLPDGSIELMEVKSSSSPVSGARDHRVDACFQMIVAERAGHEVARVMVVHVDPDYVRGDELDPSGLLVMADVTEDVRAMEPVIAAAIRDALDLLADPGPPPEGCGCRHLGDATRRCRGFASLNSDIPEASAHLLSRISRSRLRALDLGGRLAMPDVFAAELTPLQRPVWESFRTGEAVIDRAALASFLARLEGPIAFYDYESFAGAVPIAPGLSPHAQIPVQFSLHVLDGDRLEHAEHLCGEPGRHGDLVAALEAAMPRSGSILVWNQGYEKGCNRRLADLLPHHRAFLEDVNRRTVDLMDPFRAAWVDHRFRGSTSIKRVLPVLCPDLAYDETAVHDGAGAMEAWLEMATTADADRRSDLRAQLLSYCALDSLAMVRIFEKLRAEAAG